VLFARNINGPLSSLLKQLDSAVAKNKDAELRSVAFFLTDDADATEAKLKELAAKQKLSENIPLTVVEGVAGPPAWQINEGADLTVMLYTEGKVVSNFAFKAGELDEKKVKAIVAEIPKILPAAEKSQASDKKDGDSEQKKKVEELKKKLEERKKQDEKGGSK
jgi:hypothetical protein